MITAYCKVASKVLQTAFLAALVFTGGVVRAQDDGLIPEAPLEEIVPPSEPEVLPEPILEPVKAARTLPVRPNIVLIIADDQRFDMLDPFMPITRSLIFNQGMAFDRAYITTAACCPSRSSMLTGQYASHHGVVLNSSKLLGPTIAHELQASGYYTGLIGKYLNSWNGTPRNEFNYWSAFKAGSVNYINPPMNVNGKKMIRKGYITDILASDSQKFIAEASTRNQPFFLMFAPNAPHAPATPSHVDAKLFAGLAPYRPPNWGPFAALQKPAWVSFNKRIWRAQSIKVDKFRLKQIRTLHSFDNAVGTIMNELNSRSLLDNTVVIYMSDNGLMMGEYGLESKDCAYEGAVRVPFAVRIPGVTVNAPSIDGRLVSNVDLAPTILELAQIPPRWPMDGLSLGPILRQEESVPWRKELLIEGFRYGRTRKPFKALHTIDHKYIRNYQATEELYDLKSDPYELLNLVGDPAFAALHAEMSGRLTNLLVANGIPEAAPVRGARD